MNQKKSKKIIVFVIILLLILIIISSLLLVYFLTDIFKGNKELFFKYISQISNNENGFVEQNVQTYLNKKNTNSYNNEGSFSINAVDSSVTNIENLNNFNISFSGKKDNTNSKEEQNISLNYSSNVTFPLVYRKIGNQLGIQTDYVGARFLTVEPDKLNNLQGENINEIKNLIKIIGTLSNLTNIQINQEQLNSYTNIFQNINEDKFSKLSDLNGTGYRLTLQGSETQELVINLLETLKNDQALLENLNNYLKDYKNSTNITTNNIEELISNMKNNNYLNNKNLEITVYKNNGKLSKILFSINELNLDIQKIITDENNIQYNVLLNTNYNNENLTLNGKINLNNLNTENVQETYELTLQKSDKNYTYKLENNVNFSNDISIEDFTTENTSPLTNFDEVTVENFLVTVRQRIEEVNNGQMLELGYQENPVTKLMPNLGIYSDLINNLNSPKISEEDVLTFNNKFEVYQSTNLQGVTVRGLLSTIELNNEQQQDNSSRQIKEINFNGEEYEVNEQNIAGLKEEIVPENYYRVEFEKDMDTGLIYRAVINPK